MFHMTIMEEVAREQQSDRLKKAEIARLLKKTQLSNRRHGTHYLWNTLDFLNRLRLAGQERLTANKAGLLTQKC